MFKNNISFTYCILKINNTFFDNVEDVEIVMGIYNVLEYYRIVTIILANQEVYGIFIEAN